MKWWKPSFFDDAPMIAVLIATAGIFLFQLQASQRELADAAEERIRRLKPALVVHLGGEKNKLGYSKEWTVKLENVGEVDCECKFEILTDVPINGSWKVFGATKPYDGGTTREIAKGGSVMLDDLRFPRALVARPIGDATPEDAKWFCDNHHRIHGDPPRLRMSIMARSEKSDDFEKICEQVWQMIGNPVQLRKVQ
ncbi:MAG: hypothetical protein AB1752_09725 [Candidatus Zixiibacteriota bacterium]